MLGALAIGERNMEKIPDQTLDLIREAFEGDPRNMADGFRLAAKLLDLVTICRWCNGRGTVADATVGFAFEAECTDCDARGWLFDPDRLEAAMEAAGFANAPSVIKHRIEAALLVYFTE